MLIKSPQRLLEERLTLIETDICRLFAQQVEERERLDRVILVIEKLMTLFSISSKVLNTLEEIEQIDLKHKEMK